MTLRHIVTGLGMTGLALAGTAGEAHAVGWGTIVSSLGSAYGDYTNEGYSFARTDAYYKDNRPGGAPVYVRTVYQSYRQNCSGQGCNPAYYNLATRTTVRTTSSSYVYSYTHFGLDAQSDKSRGVINICQDEAYTYDPCSTTTSYPGFTY